MIKKLICRLFGHRYYKEVIQDESALYGALICEICGDIQAKRILVDTLRPPL
jgi:hypothetical protein